MVLSGMSDEQQVEDNLSYMKDFAPLSDEEKDLVAKSAASSNPKKRCRAQAAAIAQTDVQ